MNEWWWVWLWRVEPRLLEEYMYSGTGTNEMVGLNCERGTRLIAVRLGFATKPVSISKNWKPCKSYIHLWYMCSIRFILLFSQLRPKTFLYLAFPLCLLFRSSLDQGSLPNDWLVANICAMHKKGSKKSPNNYRPVSLTSQVVKLFEKVILERLIHFYNKNNIQHGFQSGCSCLTNLLECLNDWTSTFDIPGSVRFAVKS